MVLRAKFDAAAAARDLRVLIGLKSAAAIKAKDTAVAVTTDQLKTEARKQVVAGFSGQARRFGPARDYDRLSKTIQDRLYGVGAESGAAGIVYSKFGKRAGGVFRDYFAPFTTGATQRPRSAKMLLIPFLPIHRRPGAFERFLRREAENINYAPQPDKGRTLIFHGIDPKNRDLVGMFADQVKMPRLLSFDGLNPQARLAQNLRRAFRDRNP